ncbi:MAG: hypothetical protein ACRC20_01730 [Segniliparus sp.]|uniref:Rv0361 family membrane protein n=1 Tax=Segniliparus sp. TaxID=2804064 RepID=UPI003F2BEFE1
MNSRFNRAWWRINAVLAVVIVLVAGGYALHIRSQHRRVALQHTAEGDVRQAVAAYLAALADGDLEKLRESTCDGYHNGFFRTVDPAQYKAVHDNEAAAGNILVLDGFGPVVLSPPTAQAEAVAHSQSAPQSTRLAFSLRQTGEQWQVCDPEEPKAPGSATATRAPATGK